VNVYSQIIILYTWGLGFSSAKEEGARQRLQASLNTSSSPCSCLSSVNCEAWAVSRHNHTIWWPTLPAHSTPSTSLTIGTIRVESMWFSMKSPRASGSPSCLSRMLPSVFTRKCFGKSPRASSPSHKHRWPLHKLGWRVSQDLEVWNLQHLMRANTDSKEVCKPRLTLGQYLKQALSSLN